MNIASFNQVSTRKKYFNRKSILFIINFNGNFFFQPTENKTAVANISSNFYEQSDESISEGSRLREKRHIRQ